MKFCSKKVCMITIILIAIIIVIGISLVNINTRQENDVSSVEITEDKQDSTSAIQETQQKEYALAHQLHIIDIDEYAGIYMEDGTDDIVSEVMMIEVKNESEEDLQLARIYITYADIVTEFEVTNLSSGSSAVLLEKNQSRLPAGEPVKIEAHNVVFFNDKMSLIRDKIEIIGEDGMLNVKNIVQEDMDGDVYIYYKHKMNDRFYGGITYRAKVKGISVGETIKISAEHYRKDSSEIVMVTINE